MEPTLVVSLVALFVSCFTFIYQNRNLGRARDLVILTQMMQEFRSEEFQAHRLHVHKLTKDKLKNLDPDGALSDDLTWSHLRPLLHYYDNIGLLMAFNIVAEAPIIAFLGKPMLDTWELSSDFIETQRSIRGDKYLKYFQEAADKAKSERSRSEIVSKPI